VDRRNIGCKHGWRPSPVRRGSALQVAVSVILPVYNAEDFLAEALQSVLSQTHQNFELIAIDDGSTDRSPDILAEFASRDRRILARTQRNRGFGVTANECLKKAQNELVVRFDADDLMIPTRLERQIVFMQEHPELSVATSYAWLIDRWARVVGVAKPKVDIERGIRELDPEYFVELVDPSTIMRKQHVEAAGSYRGEHPILQDRALWGRLVALGYRVGVQPEFLMKQRLHRSSLTGYNCRGNVVIGKFIDYNIVLALQGKASVSFNSFLQSRKDLPFLRRLARDADELGLAYYRQATRDLAERDWWGLLRHGIAAICLRPTIASRMFQKLAREQLVGGSESNGPLV
jgi:glycosyltransferase involved in cell wall biosynthesis